VQLSGEARSFELLCLDDPADDITADPLGQLDGDRGSRRERLRESDVLVREARRRTELVVRDDDSDGSALDNEWDVQGRAHAHSTSDLLIERNRAAVAVPIHYRHRESGAPFESTKANFWTLEDGWPVKLTEYHDIARVQAFVAAHAGAHPA